MTCIILPPTEDNISTCGFLSAGSRLFLKVDVWSSNQYFPQLVVVVPQKLINVPWAIQLKYTVNQCLQVPIKIVCADSCLLLACAYPVLLRKVIPVVQLLDIHDGWNQKAGVHLPLVLLS